MRNILMVFAQFESDMNSQKTKNQMVTAIKNGLWTGGNIPLGYDRKDESLLVNEDEASVVNYIFDLYLKHKSVPKIRKISNKEGYRNKQWETQNETIRGGKKFTDDSLYRILERRLYIGEFEMDGEFYETKFDSIIKKEKFNKVQKIRAVNSRKSKTYTLGKSPNLLEGITCGICDYSMTPKYTKKSKKKYYYYKCVKKNNKGDLKDHNPKSLPYQTVDNFALNSLKAFLEEPKLLEAFKKRVEFNSEDRLKELRTELTGMRNNKKNLVTKIDEIQETALMNSNNFELWDAELTDLKSEKDSIDTQISLKEKRD